MTAKRPRKRLDQKVKYVGLPHWLLNCPAWQALRPAAKVIYIEAFELRYNGCNNGDIKLSEREVAALANCARETASSAIDSLVAHGFIRPNIKGRFHVKVRFATRWILTRYEHGGQKPTVDFVRWQRVSGIQPEQPIEKKQTAKFKQRDQFLGQTGLETRPDEVSIPTSGIETRPDSADSDPPTGPDSRPVLVYQGTAPKGTRQAKAAWLRGHIASGVLTPDAIAAVLSIRPHEVESIAAGKTELANPSWRKIGALVASRLH